MLTSKDKENQRIYLLEPANRIETWGAGDAKLSFPSKDFELNS